MDHSTPWLEQPFISGQIPLGFVCEKLLELYSWEPEENPTFGSSSTIYCNPCTSTSLLWFYVASSKVGM